MLHHFDWADWKYNVSGVTLVFALAASACATGETTDIGGGTPDGGGGGEAGSASGTGGDGGSTGPCAVDCGAIETPQCQIGQCNLQTGQCEVVADDDGSTCDDGLFCTVDDTCSAGQCVGGPQNDCSLTADECELITCDEQSQSCSLASVPNGEACTPTDLCQSGGTCTNGLCTGTPKDCFFSPVPNECHESICNPQTGDCEPVVDPNAQGQPCAGSGDLCMDNKTCDNGGNCLGGTPKDCSHLTVGCTNGVCDANNGLCIGDPVAPGGACFDGVPACNTGTCDNNSNCVPSPVANGTACDDYNACTTGDLCTNGTCGGTAVTNCTTYFEEYFDTSCPPGGWTVNPDWECGVPTSGPSSVVSGTSCLATILAGDYNNNLTYAQAYAETPPIDLSSATEPVLLLQAWINTEGSSYDGWNVKVSTDGGQTFNVLNTVEPAYNLNIESEACWGGDLSSLGWQQVTANLTAFVGGQVILRMSMRTDGSVTDPGVYIDDVQVIEASEIPITITSTSPLSNAYVGYAYSQNVQRTGGSSGAAWSITGGTNIGWLSINAATGELYGNPQNGDAGPVSVDVHVEEGSVPTNFDDATLTFDVAQALFFEDFEGTCPNGWTLGGDWQCGTPTQVGPSSAFSGVQCLGTQLASDYNMNQAWATATASSPAINLAGTTAPQLSAWAWMNTEGSTYDGANLKISTDGGQTYTLYPTPVPAYTLTIDNESAWGGDESSLGWQEITADLTSFAGQTIHVQVAFRSDGSFEYPGVYIDEVLVYE